MSDQNSGGGQDQRPGETWNADPTQQIPAAEPTSPPTQPIPAAPPMPAPLWAQQPQQPQQPYQQQPQQPYEQQQPYPQQQPAQFWGAAGGAQLPHQPTVQPFEASTLQPARRRPSVKWSIGIGSAAIVALVVILVTAQSSGPAVGAKLEAAKPSPTPTPSGYQPTASTPTAKAAETAGVFLAAWQNGDFQQAASYTDQPAAAAETLSSYRTDLGLHGLQLTEGTAAADGVVDFTVHANIASTAAVTAAAATAPSPSDSSAGTALSGTAGSTTFASGTWTYKSHVTVYQKNGGWWINWSPSLVAPGMTASLHPVALAIKPTVASVTDSSGASLAASPQAALQSVAEIIRENTQTSQGTAGLEIVLQDSSGRLVSDSKSVLSSATSSGTVTTTIDPRLESVATAAVAKLPRSAMVVIRPSTGAILAVANSTGSGDIALTGTLAPGSSMKVVTTTGLLADNLLPTGIATPVGCPLVETVQGVMIHNSTTSANSSKGTEDFEPPNTPFSTDFAQSCNNAFTQWWQQMAGGKLADAASGYYGLNQPWDIGLGSKGTYFSMPGHSSGSELAEELYGQGLIEANPLSMASIAATVDTGMFHQPYLVGGLTDKATASPLPPAVKSQLYTVMSEVVTSGTAASVGFGPGVYGKTGTAEADANKDHNPNGWMIVFDPAADIAIGAVVLDSNFGASTAGPETNYVLQHLP